MKTAKLKLLSEYPVIIMMLLLFISSGNLLSQVNDCSFSYYKAMSLYNLGKVDTAYSLLSSCLNDKKLYRKTSKSTRAEIYRLSALSCILLEKPDEARENIRKLLAYQPYYKENFKDGDLLEFRSMVNEFSVQPKFVIGVNLFKDYSHISLDKILTHHGATNTSERIDCSSIGLSLFIENTLTKRISIGLGFSGYSFSFIYRVIPIHFFPEYDRGTEFKYFEVPVFANYRLRIDKRIKPYFQFGIIGRYQREYIANYRISSSEYGPYYIDKSYPTVTAIFFRNSETLDFIVGTGVTYSFKRTCFNFNIGYLPHLLKNNPLQNVEDITDVSNDELFRQADKTIVIDMKRKIRLSLSYKYFINYKAFR